MTSRSADWSSVPSPFPDELADYVAGVEHECRELRFRTRELERCLCVIVADEGDNALWFATCALWWLARRELADDDELAGALLVWRARRMLGLRLQPDEEIDP